MADTKNEATDRRSRSISRLIANNVPYINHLPHIETEDEVLRRASDEVGLRAICLSLISMKGAGADHNFILDGIEHYNLAELFSPREIAFVFDENPSEHEKLQLSWRSEAVHALLWSVSAVETLSYPSECCDWNQLWGIFHNAQRGEFLESLKLRSQAEILDEADFIYRLHWAVRDAQLDDREPPAKLNSSVVMERHHALNWLVPQIEEFYAWDEVPTDT
jgi:hypothetical protein